MVIILLNSAVFVLGLTIGSFLNVCIYRMPKNISIKKPERSFCPHCNETIPWYDNIPVLSFLLLKGRCRFCKKGISFLYPLVELITAVMFLVFFNVFGASIKALVYLVLCCGLIIATFVDIRHRIIPDEISVGGIVVGILFGGFAFAPQSNFKDMSEIFVSLLGSLIVIGFICLVRIIWACLQEFLSKEERKEEDTNEPEEVDIKGTLRELLLLIPAGAIGWYGFRFMIPIMYSAPGYVIGILTALIGASVGASIIYITAIIGDLVFRKESMGGGDIKLLAAIGAFLGWQQVLLTFMLAPFFGAIVGIIVKIVKKTSLIPYGPFLSMAALMVLFWYNEIMQWWSSRLYQGF
ncbi:prepilin peptidase [Candidatus Omnitrophota bacterium]